ncbi:hypothetical protein LCGC14_2121610 [marine sediment metagenome]|uniref:Uncharacterized protein n=1 Tax=marine sediment metagenome TaxID=412755 RepID=A0A0F9E469_9ZZZZ
MKGRFILNIVSRIVAVIQLTAVVQFLIQIVIQVIKYEDFIELMKGINPVNPRFNIVYLRFLYMPAMSRISLPDFVFLMRTSRPLENIQVFGEFLESLDVAPGKYSS